ncbi:MAG: RDD family protein [Rhodobacteraceae bacterium]|nr:RDD family protein [Paracoccaceae bacterium]
MSRAARPAAPALADPRATWRVETVIPPEGVPLPFRIAELGTRLFAQVTDLVLTLLFLGLLVLTLGLTLGSGEYLAVIATLGFFFLRLPYYILSEIYWNGATLGKRLAGIKVINAQGGSLDIHAIVLRNLLKEAEVFLPLGLALGMGDFDGFGRLSALAWCILVALIPLRSRRNQRLGDIWPARWWSTAPMRCCCPMLHGVDRGQPAGGRRVQLRRRAARPLRGVRVADARRPVAQPRGEGARAPPRPGRLPADGRGDPGDLRAHRLSGRGAARSTGFPARLLSRPASFPGGTPAVRRTPCGQASPAPATGRPAIGIARRPGGLPGRRHGGKLGPDQKRDREKGTCEHDRHVNGPGPAAGHRRHHLGKLCDLLSPVRADLPDRLCGLQLWHAGIRAVPGIRRGNRPCRPGPFQCRRHRHLSGGDRHSGPVLWPRRGRHSAAGL